jgi:hypothetical protein
VRRLPHWRASPRDGGDIWDWTERRWRPKGDGALACRIERSDAIDDDIAVASELGAAALGKLAQRDPDSVW